MEINDEEKLDPLFTRRTNWHLQPSLNMSGLLAVSGLLEKDTGLEESQKASPIPDSGHSSLVGIAVTFGIVSLLIACFCRLDDTPLLEIEGGSNLQDHGQPPSKFNGLGGDRESPSPSEGKIRNLTWKGTASSDSITLDVSL
jgi:hypothetical protein